MPTSDFCVAFVHGHDRLARNHTKSESLYGMRHVKLLTNSRIDCFDDGPEHVLFGLHGWTVAQTLPPVRAEQGICRCQIGIAGVIGKRIPDQKKWLQGSVAPPANVNTKLAARTAAAQQGTCGSPPSGRRGC